MTENLSDTAEKIITQAQKWTFEGDCMILEYMQNISEKLESRAMKTTESLLNLNRKVSRAQIALENTQNSLTALQYTQFVEMRCQEDELTEELPKVSNETPPQDMLQVFLKNNIQMLHNCHDKYNFLDESDDEENATAAANCIYQPRNPYNDRLLPHIYGTKLWRENWHVGLLEGAADFSGDEASEVYSISSASSGDNESFKSDNTNLSQWTSSASINNEIVANRPSTAPRVVQQTNIQDKAYTATTSSASLFDLPEPAVTNLTNDKNFADAENQHNIKRPEAPIQQPVPTKRLAVPNRTLNLFDDNDFTTLVPEISNKVESGYGDSLPIQRPKVDLFSSSNNSPTEVNFSENINKKLPENTESYAVPSTKQRNIAVNLFDSRSNSPIGVDITTTKSEIPKPDIFADINEKATLKNNESKLKISAKSLFDDDEDDDDFLNLFGSKKSATSAGFGEQTSIATKKVFGSDLFSDANSSQKTLSQTFRSDNNESDSKAPRHLNKNPNQKPTKDLSDIALFDDNEKMAPTVQFHGADSAASKKTTLNDLFTDVERTGTMSFSTALFDDNDEDNDFFESIKSKATKDVFKSAEKPQQTALTTAVFEDDSDSDQIKSNFVAEKKKSESKVLKRTDIAATKLVHSPFFDSDDNNDDIFSAKQLSQPSATISMPKQANENAEFIAESPKTTQAHIEKSEITKPIHEKYISSSVSKVSTEETFINKVINKSKERATNLPTLFADDEQNYKNDEVLKEATPILSTNNSKDTKLQDPSLLPSMLPKTTVAENVQNIAEAEKIPAQNDEFIDNKINHSNACEEKLKTSESIADSEAVLKEVSKQPDDLEAADFTGSEEHIITNENIPVDVPDFSSNIAKPPKFDSYSALFLDEPPDDDFFQTMCNPSSTKVQSDADNYFDEPTTIKPNQSDNIKDDKSNTIQYSDAQMEETNVQHTIETIEKKSPELESNSANISAFSFLSDSPPPDDSFESPIIKSTNKEKSATVSALSYLSDSPPPDDIFERPTINTTNKEEPVKTSLPSFLSDSPPSDDIFESSTIQPTTKDEYNESATVSAETVTSLPQKSAVSKLKMPAININVQALLPTAALPRARATFDEQQQIDSNSTSTSVIIEKSNNEILTPVNAQERQEKQHILPNLCRNRVQAPKRRSSTRRGRQESYQKTLLAQQEEERIVSILPKEFVATPTPQVAKKQSIDDIRQKSNIKLDAEDKYVSPSTALSRQQPSTVIVSNVSSNVAGSKLFNDSDDEDDFFGKLTLPKVNKTITTGQHDTAPLSKKDDDDLFSHPTASNVAGIAVNKTINTSQQITAPVPKSSLNTVSDEGLFSTSKVANKEFTAAESQRSTKTSKKLNALFDTDSSENDDGDLFGTSSKAKSTFQAGKKTNVTESVKSNIEITKSKGLFSDSDDDDDDLFGSSSNAKLPKRVNPRTNISSRREEFSKPHPQQSKLPLVANVNMSTATAPDNPLADLLNP